jgi:protein PET100
MLNYVRRTLQGTNLEVFKVSAHHHLSLSFLYFGTTALNPSTYSFTMTLVTNTSSQFGMYLAFPIGYMYYFGTNLEDRFSVPGFWPTKEQSHKLPYEREEIKAEVERIRRDMQQRRQLDDARVAFRSGAGKETVESGTG